MKKRPIIVSVCVILIVTTAAFLPALDNGFVNWDDDLFVAGNTRIRELSWRNAGRIFTSRHRLDYYKPLTEFSYAVEYHLFGLNPRAFHAANLFFHLVNALLVFWLILIVSGRTAVAFVAALLFGVHPLQVESVAWITQRKDVLYALFFLGTLISYLFYLKKAASKYYRLSVCFFIVSLLAKPQGIPLPFLLFLFDWLRGRKFDRKAFLDKVPFLLIAVVFVIIAYLGVAAAGRLSEEKPIPGISNFLIAAYGLTFYLGKLALPVNLSCVYPYPGNLSLFFLLPPLALVALVIGAAYSGRQTRKLIFAGLFFLINILLVVQFVPTRPTIAADHYAYIPSIAVFYLAGEIIFRLARGKGRRFKFLVPVSAVIVVLLLVTLTRRRCRVWQDGETLWNDVLRNYPNAYIAHNNLGNVLASRDKFGEAIAHYRQALRSRPEFAEGHVNIGIAFAKQDKPDQAVLHFAEALRIDPANPRAYCNWGLTLAAEERLKEAVSLYRKALEGDTDYAKAHYCLGLTLARMGELKDAIHHYNQALRIEPAYPEALRDRKLTLKKLEEGK